MRIAELISLPTVIVATGRYITRCGEVVTIHRLTGADNPLHRGWADGQYSDGTSEKWDISGRLLSLSQSRNDIVGMNP